MNNGTASGSPNNILVVSDLHLGEDLLPGITADKRHAVELAESAFIDFLRYHQRFRVGGRPWRLVIDGDLFDFMSVSVGAADGVSTRDDEERLLGAARRPDAAAVRMRVLVTRYRAVLAQLMRFCAAGHRVDVIAGNHDRELAWPAVWAVMIRGLRDAAPPGIDADAALDRIAIHPWFVYEPGVAWIEHGHVYDEACSYDYNLAPEDPRTGELVTNVDYAAMRYLGYAAPECDVHGTEEWSFGGYMRYAWSRGPAQGMRLVVGYFKFVAALVRARKMHFSHKIRDERAARHERALAAVAQSTGVARDVVDRIDALAIAPMPKSTRRLGRMLKVDRWLVVLGVALAMLAMLIALPLWAAMFGGAAAIAIGHRASAMLGPPPAVQAAMPIVPRQIRALVDAPVVVFGHTHEPLRLPLVDGGMYLNTGTWLPAIRPGLLRSFTHVAIVDGVAELRQWKDGHVCKFVERDPTPVPRSLRPAPRPPLPVRESPAPVLARRVI
jgi:UDP-2,3-diacylglucosamine pyrophosphatase LpxH